MCIFPLLQRVLCCALVLMLIYDHLCDPVLQLEVQVSSPDILSNLPRLHLLTCRKYIYLPQANCPRALSLSPRGRSRSCFPWPHCYPASRTKAFLSFSFPFPFLWCFADPCPCHHQHGAPHLGSRVTGYILVHVHTLSQDLSYRQNPSPSHKPLGPGSKLKSPAQMPLPSQGDSSWSPW